MDLTAVTFGSEELAGANWQVVQAAQRTGGGIVICCEGRIQHVVKIAFGGTLTVRNTLAGAKELIESMKAASDAADHGPEPPLNRTR